MSRFSLVPCTAALILAVAGHASAQEADTFSISGTFRPGEATPGLAAKVLALVESLADGVRGSRAA